MIDLEEMAGIWEEIWKGFCDGVRPRSSLARESAGFSDWGELKRPGEKEDENEREDEYREFPELDSADCDTTSKIRKGRRFLGKMVVRFGSEGYEFVGKCGVVGDDVGFDEEKRDLVEV